MTCPDCHGDGELLVDEDAAAEMIDDGREPLRGPSTWRMQLPCPGCFQTYDLDEAKASFDDQYGGSSDQKYDVVVPMHMCADCASEDADARWMDGELESADGPPPSADEMRRLADDWEETRMVSLPWVTLRAAPF